MRLIAALDTVVTVSLRAIVSRTGLTQEARLFTAIAMSSPNIALKLYHLRSPRQCFEFGRIDRKLLPLPRTFPRSNDPDRYSPVGSVISPR